MDATEHEPENLYEQYVRCTVDLRRHRQARHQTLISRLREDAQQDQSAFIKRLQGEADLPVEKTPEQFRDWWGSLDDQTRTVFRRRFSQSVDEVIESGTQAIRQVVEQTRRKEGLAS